MLFNLWILWDQSPLKLSDETLSNLLFLNRHFKKLSKYDKSQKKAEFKAPKMKPMRFIQATPKAKTKILSQKRKTSNDSKGKSFRRPRKKDLKQALIQKIMMKKTWLMTSLMVH